MNDHLVFGLELTLVGMGIVYFALVLIVAAISGMKRLDERWRAAEQAGDEAAFGKSPNVDYTTLVLISAAVATMLVGRARIRSVRRLAPADFASSPWSVTGRAVLQGSHVITGRSPRA